MLSIFIGGSFLTGFTVSINKQTIFRYFNHFEEIKNKKSFQITLFVIFWNFPKFYYRLDSLKMTQKLVSTIPDKICGSK